MDGRKTRDLYYGVIEMRGLFIEYLQSPSQETYHRVRNALITSDSYNPYSNEVEEIQNLLEAKNFNRAIEAFVVFDITDCYANLSGQFGEEQEMCPRIYND